MKSNALLARITLLLIILIQPILLVFGPLPGYLYYTSSLLSIAFFLSLTFLLVCSYISHIIYNSLIDRKYYDWIILAIGSKRFVISYIISHARFSILTSLFLILGLFKVDDIYIAIPRIILILSLHLIFYMYSAKAILKRGNIKSVKYPYIHLGTNYIKSALFHFLIYFLLCSAYLLLFLITNYGVRVAYASIVTVFLGVISVAIFRIIRLQVNRHADFLKLISPSLYQGIYYLFYSLIGAFLIFPLLIFLILIIN